MPRSIVIHDLGKGCVAELGGLYVGRGKSYGERGNPLEAETTSIVRRISDTHLDLPPDVYTR